MARLGCKLVTPGLKSDHKSDARQLSPITRKLVFEVCDQDGLKPPAHQQKLARALKFQIQKLEILYYYSVGAQAVFHCEQQKC